MWIVLSMIALAEAKKPPMRPLNLWVVEKDGATSHLFGTCHLAIPLEQALPAPHDRGLREAAVVVTEADVAIDPMRALRLLYSSDQAPLSTRLPPEDWRALAVRLRPLPAPVLDRFPDWVIESLLTVGMPEPSSRPVLDLAVAEAAPGARRVYLETLEEQALILGAIPVDPASWLRPTPEDLTQAGAVSGACGSGDLSGFEDLAGDPSYEALIGQRNRAWVPKLSPLLADGGAFVAVGVGHMVGEQGLVTLLEAEGFEVRRVSGRVAAAAVPPFGATVAPAPAYDLAAVEDARARMPQGMSELLCAPSGPVATCFQPDHAACVAQLSRDVELCLLQSADRIGVLAPVDLAQEVGGCAVTGLMLDGLMSGELGPEPMCQQIGAAMSGGM